MQARSHDKNYAQFSNPGFGQILTVVCCILTLCLLSRQGLPKHLLKKMCAAGRSRLFKRRVSLQASAVLMHPLKHPDTLS